MKTLMVLRHAKSSWKYKGLPDHERPLNRRGQRNAPRMGHLMKEEGILPEHILSSTAVRAQTTARLVAHACGHKGDVELIEELYLSGAQAYFDVLREIPDGVASVMVVGHNPDLEDLVFSLTGQHETLATATLAKLELPVDSWAELRKGFRGALVGVWRPKELPDG